MLRLIVGIISLGSRRDVCVLKRKRVNQTTFDTAVGVKPMFYILSVIKTVQYVAPFTTRTAVRFVFVIYSSPLLTYSSRRVPKKRPCAAYRRARYSDRTRYKCGRQCRGRIKRLPYCKQGWETFWLIGLSIGVRGNEIEIDLSKPENNRNPERRGV